jgi:hypothetical protein
MKLYSFFDLAARWGEWSTSRPGRFTPRKDPVPVVYVTGWASGPVWTGAENLVPTGIRYPDLPSRSESLDRLSYPGPTNEMEGDEKCEESTQFFLICDALMSFSNLPSAWWTTLPLTFSILQKAAVVSSQTQESSYSLHGVTSQTSLILTATT